MRKIEQQMNDAIRERKIHWESGNTWVGFYETPNSEQIVSEIFLHGNNIASYDHKTGQLKVNLYTLRRWPSMTTRSRLRALGADLVSIKGVLHLNGKSIYSEAE